MCDDARPSHSQPTTSTTNNTRKTHKKTQKKHQTLAKAIARGSDAPSTRDQTVRVHIVNAQVLASRKDVIQRFVKAYRESLAYLYDTPEGLKLYADYAQIDLDLAAKIRDEFMPKAAMNPDKVSGIEAITKDAIGFKVLQKPLTDAELKELIQIPAP